MNIPNLKGNTLEDKINSLIDYFESIEKDEKIGISLDGFEKMLSDLNVSLPNLNKELKEKFELQDEYVLKASTLFKIHEGFKTSKYQEFPHVLFRDIIINEERILKALTK